MADLLLDFGIPLKNFWLEPRRQHNGPLFHRWLPDGEKDAISIDTGDPDAELKVWFERRGYVDTFIKFDWQRHEVDPVVMEQQGVLDAGPLKGSLLLRNLPEATMQAVKDDKCGDPAYVSLGKRAVKLVFPAVSKLLTLLRVNYGQYWIREPERWDSREMSLGQYTRVIIQMEWSADGGVTWEKFIPNEPETAPIVLVMDSRIYLKYITQTDWQEISRVIDSYEATVAAVLVARAHELLDHGRVRYALFEGVTALEVAIGEFIRERQHGSKDTAQAMAAFWDMPLRARFSAVSVLSGRMSTAQTEDVLRAVDLRNETIHEGGDPPSGTADVVSHLLEAIATLLPAPRFKFATGAPGNTLRSPQNWKKSTP